jgi:hypothetical protein
MTKEYYKKPMEKAKAMFLEPQKFEVYQRMEDPSWCTVKQVNPQ